jgi:RNA polymerase sigma factor (sigma-70 family)
VVRREVNRQIHHHLKREVGLECEDLAEAPAAGAWERIEEMDFARLLSRLTPREEEVLMLRMESLKYREIARALGISQNTVNSLLARALRKLHEALQPPGRPLALTAGRGAKHVLKTLQ